MTGLTITNIAVIDCADLVARGDDRFLVAVQADGLTGWYGPVGDAAAAVIERRLATAVIGAAVPEHDKLLRRLREAVGNSVGTAESWAVGAVDCAVWDLHGRAEDVSVAELLAATPLRRVPAYASWLTLNLAAPGIGEHVASIAGQGWQFTKWALRAAPDATDRAGAQQQLLSSAQTAIRAAGASAAFDALWSWNKALLASLATAVPDGLLWVEEPLAVNDTVQYENAAPELPLALGERLLLGDDPTSMLALPTLTAFTLDVVGCGGITAAAVLIRQAKAAGIAVYPHGRSLMPALHLAAASPDAVAAVEYQLRWEPRRRRLFTDPLDTERGHIIVPQTPGLGPQPRRHLCPQR